MSNATQNEKVKKGKQRNFAKRIAPLVEYFKNCEDKTIGISAIKQLDKQGYLIRELRREYKLGKLLPEEIELLEYMGMKWEHTFMDSIEPLKLWCTKNKHDLGNANQYSKLEINVDGETITYDIGELVRRFRMARRNGELSEPQIKILNMMGLVWEPRKADILYAQLIAYGEEVGTLKNIPKNMVYELDGETRNIWRQAERLRQKYKQGELDQDTIDTFVKYDLWHGLEDNVYNELSK